MLEIKLDDSLDPREIAGVYVRGLAIAPNDSDGGKILAYANPVGSGVPSWTIHIPDQYGVCPQFTLEMNDGSQYDIPCEKPMDFYRAKVYQIRLSVAQDVTPVRINVPDDNTWVLYDLDSTTGMVSLHSMYGVDYLNNFALGGIEYPVENNGWNIKLESSGLWNLVLNESLNSFIALPVEANEE